MRTLKDTHQVNRLTTNYQNNNLEAPLAVRGRLYSNGGWLLTRFETLLVLFCISKVFLRLVISEVK